MKLCGKIFCANGGARGIYNPPQRSAPVPYFLLLQLKGNRQFLRKLTHGECQNLTDCDFCKDVRSAHIAVCQFHDLSSSVRKVKTDFTPFIVVVCIPMYCFVLVCSGGDFFVFFRSALIPPHREHRHPPEVRSACPRFSCRLALRRWWCCTRKRWQAVQRNNARPTASPVRSSCR